MPFTKLISSSISSISIDTIPSLPASKIASGSLDADRIPDLPTSKITSGTFADGRLSSSSVTQYVDLTSLSASNLTSGTIPNSRYGTPTFSAANLTSLPAPSSANVGSATAGLGTGAVGTYAILCNNTDWETVNPGGTKSGNDLRYANVEGNINNAPSGTWRCMGYQNANNNRAIKTTGWLRIS